MTHHVERAPRKNIFLAAAIEAGALKAQVRIRNMSVTGAMIDGAVLPARGAALVLKRGEVEIGAVVIWSLAGRCGIKFDGSAHVEEWIAGKRLPEADASLTGQGRVDAVQAAIRAGRSLDSLEEARQWSAAPALSPLPSSRDAMPGRIGEEVAAIQRLIEAVGDSLSDDPLMLARHANHLQSLQSASEVLNQLARVLQASNVEAAVESVTLQALRARLLRKPMF